MLLSRYALVIFVTDAQEPISLVFDRNEEVTLIEVVNSTMPDSVSPIMHKIKIQPDSALNIMVNQYIGDTNENGKIIKYKLNFYI